MDTKSQTGLSAGLAGTIFFILWGLDLIAGEFPHKWNIPMWVPGIFFASTLFVLPIGMCIGWVQGFPRWSYPYVGHVIVFSLYMTNVATPGFLFGRELWSWWAWIPLMVITLIALAVTRSFHPIFKFFTNIRDDWTLLTFAMFGFMPLLVSIGFDEMDRLFSLYFMVLVTVVMSGAAWFYMRSVAQRQRVIALLAGILLTTGVIVIAPTLYWLKNGWVNPTGMAIMGGIVVVIMFLPSLIGLGRRKVTS